MAVIRFTKEKADKSLQRSEEKQDAEASEEAISVLRDAINARKNEWGQHFEAMIREASVEIAELSASLPSKEAESSGEQHEMLQETVKGKTEELKSLEQQSEQADAEDEVGWISVIRYTYPSHTQDYPVSMNLFWNRLFLQAC